MQLTRQHLAFSIAFVTLLGLFGAALAAYSNTLPGHPLGQVYSISGQGIRVGMDDGIPGSPATAGDGKPDYANRADTAALSDDAAKLGGKPPSAYQSSSCLAAVTQAKGTNNGYVTLPLAAACSQLQNGGVCRLFVKMSKTGTTYTRVVDYYQDASGAFASAYAKQDGTPAATTGTNGDGTTQNAFTLNPDGSGQILIDDTSNVANLQLKNTNSAYDTTVYVCS